MVAIEPVSTTPLISIVIPLYNKQDSVLEAVASVRAQSFTHWELVVVDDGSTDRGSQLLAGIDDSRIRLHRQANAGVSAARNQGVQLARAELIAFLDADDVWYPGYLDAVMALRRDYPDARWYATGYEILPAGADHAFAARISGVPKSMQRGLMANYFHVASLSDPPVWTSAVAVDKQALLSVGGFPVGIHSGEDLLTWARLAVRYPLAIDLEPQAVFRVSGIERKPDSQNHVGVELAVLASQYPAIKKLSTYLGLWYRMQAIMYLRHRDGAAARSAARRSIRFAPYHIRNLYTLCLCLLPGDLGLSVDCLLRQWITRIKQ